MTDASSTPSNPAPWPTAPPGRPGLKAGFPEVPGYPGTEAAGTPRLGHKVMIAALVIGLGLVAAVLVVVAFVVPPGPPPHCAALKCQGPPIRHLGSGSASAASGAPVRNGITYTDVQGYSFRYARLNRKPVVPQMAKLSNGVGLTYPFQAGTAQLEVIGEPAEGTTDQGIVQALISQIAPSAQAVYQVPGATVGYQPGYGEAFDVQSASSGGSTATSRVIVLAAVHNGFGMAVIAVGPRLAPVTPTAPNWNGHPSPADLLLAYVVDPIVNSVTFPAPQGP